MQPGSPVIPLNHCQQWQHIRSREEHPPGPCVPDELRERRHPRRLKRSHVRDNHSPAPAREEKRVLWADAFQEDTAVRLHTRQKALYRATWSVSASGGGSTPHSAAAPPA